MADKKRLGVGVLVLTLGAGWASGCSSSDEKAANNAGGAGIGEAGAAQAGAPSGHAGASAAGGGSDDGGSSDGGEPSLLPDAGSAGDVGSAGDAGEAGASGEPDLRAPFAEWDRARVTAQCTKSVACSKWYSVASCVADALGGAAYAAYYAGADFYGNQLAHSTLANSAVQQTCLDDIAAQACDAGLNPPLSCTKVLLPLAPVAKGELCRNSKPYLPPLSCAAGLECARGPQCPTCVDETPLADLDGPCNYPDACKPGLVCRVTVNTSYTCQKPIALGQHCDSLGDCAAGTCLGTTCVAYVGNGKACSNTAPCLHGLSCGADNLCHPDPTPEPGASCKRHLGTSTETCNAYAWCVFATPDAATGKCGAPVGTGPTPCTRLAGASTLGCPFGTYPDAATPTNADGIPDSCSCQPRRPLGAPCTISQQCLNGQCATGANGSVCTAQLEAGKACTGAAGECEGYCDDETHQCVGPAVCGP